MRNDPVRTWPLQEKSLQMAALTWTKMVDTARQSSNALATAKPRVLPITTPDASKGEVREDKCPHQTLPGLHTGLFCAPSLAPSSFYVHMRVK